MHRSLGRMRRRHFTVFVACLLLITAPRTDRLEMVRSPSRRAIWWAIAYTAVVAGAVAATAIPKVVGRGPQVYDAAVLLDGFEVVGLIWAAYFAYQAFHTERQALQFQQRTARSERARLRRETRRRARSIAQALHVELDSIVRAAVAVRETGEPGVRYEGLPHPFLVRALESAELFQPRTIWCMANVVHAVSGLRSAIEGYRAAGNTFTMSDPLGLKLPRPAFTATLSEVRAAAVATTEEIGSLRAELLNEANDPPERREAPAYKGLVVVSPAVVDLDAPVEPPPTPS
jgi:hypothetical protein